MMDNIHLDRKVGLGQEIVIRGPLLEALLFQGGRLGSLHTLTDSEGDDYRARILRLSEKEASVLIFDRFLSSTESAVEIILLQALPEKERMELIIQKTTELGVSAIFPFKSAKSISLEERESKQKKAHRWQEIAIKAVQQSRRARVPRVDYLSSFKAALEVCESHTLKIVLWEKKGESLKELLKSSRSKKICALIGPEGGLSPTELAFLERSGFKPVYLGQGVLRVDTAAIAAIAIVKNIVRETHAWRPVN